MLWKCFVAEISQYCELIIPRAEKLYVSSLYLDGSSLLAVITSFFLLIASAQIFGFLGIGKNKVLCYFITKRTKCLVV